MFYLEMQIRHANTHLALAQYSSSLHLSSAVSSQHCWLRQERKKSLLLEPCLPPQPLGEFGVTAPWEADQILPLAMPLSPSHHWTPRTFNPISLPMQEIFSQSFQLVVLQSLNELFYWRGAHSFATKTILCWAAPIGETLFIMSQNLPPYNSYLLVLVLLTGILRIK